MKKINYTKTDLDGFTLKELQRICRYYGIQYAASWSKDKLKKEILNYAPTDTLPRAYNQRVIFETLMPDIIAIIPAETIKSTRISRIEEMRKEK